MHCELIHVTNASSQVRGFGSDAEPLWRRNHLCATAFDVSIIAHLNAYAIHHRVKLGPALTSQAICRRLSSLRQLQQFAPADVADYQVNDQPANTRWMSIYEAITNVDDEVDVAQ